MPLSQNSMAHVPGTRFRTARHPQALFLVKDLFVN